VRVFAPYDIPEPEVERLWSEITCPTLLVQGRESWASNPEEDGRVRHFLNARVAAFDKAGHWVHHDQLEAFLATVGEFLDTTRAADAAGG
jgi:pimeloyl-ACP methyl ester carboxylesterase